MKKAVRPLLFAALLLLAAYLRITGLTWGINSGYGHERNFQPDEFVSLRGVLQIDLLAGQLKAPEAYFEGTFNYYLWAIAQAVLKLVGSKTAHAANAANPADYSELLYVCRWISVLCDLCTVVVVFLAIREATRRFYPSLVGGLCYAVLPMQVIYAHFMRTHILSNFLCALVIWLSFKLRKSLRWQLLITTGLFSGLGAATRYPAGLIVIIPCLYLLLNDANDSSPPPTKRFLRRARDFASRQVWLIGLGFVIGLFIGHPMLFLDLSSVTNEITSETLKYATLEQFSTSQLLNLSVVWNYITYLIPFAIYPLLWLVPYCAVLYLLFRPRLYSQSAPVIIFSALYLYFIAKGYLGPYFARPTMLLFPGLCILVGISLADLQSELKNKGLVAVASTAALLLIFAPSVAFDIAYDRAMQQKDVREAVRDDLQTLIGRSPVTIGVLRVGGYFYTAMPAAEPLKSEKVVVQLQDLDQQADFFLVGLTGPINSNRLHLTVKKIEAQGRFRYDRSYSVRPKIFGKELRLTGFPQDMTYPFPTILLFRRRVTP